MESNKNQDLCGYSHEEITSALTLIKKICRANNCSTCPFCPGEDCELANTDPAVWEVTPTSKIWTAFSPT